MSQKTSTAQRTLSLYWDHAKVYRWHLVGLLGMMPILQFLEDFLVPIFTAQIISKVARISGPINLNEFYRPLAAILFIELFNTALWRPYIKIVWRFEENVMRDLFRSAFDHLLQMSNRFYSNRFAGSLVSQVNKFAGSFERLADSLIWNVYKLIIGYVFTVIVIGRQAPLVVLLITFFSALYVAILLKTKKTEQPYNKKWAETESARTGQLADSITNMLAVKAFAHEDTERGLYAAKTGEVHDASISTMKKVMHNELFSVTSQRLINVGAILSSLYLAAHLIIPVGTIYLSLTFTIALMRRLWDLNNTLRNLNRTFGDASEMTEIFAIKPEVKDPIKPKALSSVRGDIVLRNVSFGYEGKKGEKLFHNFSLHIKPGEKVGLVGRSGSGKTTLTKLILRFMDIDNGEILIDGQNIANVTQHDLRRAVAYVPQEPLMFHRSIAENVRYGNPDASQQELVAVAKMSNAHEFVEKLPKGYDTMVGERGTKLSGGQKQRLAIARAMIKNARILILDEATSALDSESEGLIQDALWTLMKDRTAIVIAHRLSTIQKMDRIVVMDDGAIAEQGSHKELIRLGGIYADLWMRQSGGFIEE